MNEDDYQSALSVATPEELAELERLLAPEPIPYCPHVPHPKQQIFLNLTSTLEVLYGGAAMGGKSDALLMGALQFVHVPGYAAMLFRRTFADLNLTDSLLTRSREWWTGKGPVYRDQTKTWTFPSGATVSFGYLETENDKFRYQSAAWQYIAFDELTHFTETQYRYLFSRLRRNTSTQATLPLRMRAGANPGGVGHAWVKERFIAPKDNPPDRDFIPATIKDNPSGDEEAYVKSLDQLDPITRKQLLAGDWDAWEGGRFQREWFRHAYRQTDVAYFLRMPDGTEREAAKSRCAHFTICDPAATSKTSSDFTAIIAFAVTPDKKLLVLEVVRAHLSIEDIVPTIRDVALRNQSSYVGFEAVAFQWAMIHLARNVRDMPPVRAISAHVARLPIQKGEQGKLVRATPAIVKAEAGEIFLPIYGAWLEDFVAELVLFTGDDKKDANDDQVDALAYGVLQVNFATAVQQQGPQEPKDERPHGYPSSRLVPTRDSSASRRKMFGLS